MVQKEIKPSFSLKYLLLTLLTTALVTAAGIGITKLFETKSNKELTVYIGDQVNLLNDDAIPKGEIEATYHLKGNPNKQISSLFLKTIAIKNTGNKGAENVLITASLNGSNAKLIDHPKIKTDPKEIIDAITLTKKDNSTTQKHIWNISLINPNESVILDYFVYSEKQIDAITLNVVPRKKDWKILKGSILSHEEKKTPKEISTEIAIFGGTSTFLILFFLLMSVPIYYLQWLNRPDFRSKYGYFFIFYSAHRPWNLFQPPKNQNANNTNSSNAKKRAAD